MPETASLRELLAERLGCGEDIELEFKAAHSALPKDMWSTLSAFANTQGGWVVLGVSESASGTMVTGVADPSALLKTLNDALRNPQKISYPVCGVTDASIEQIGDDALVVIRVPAAPRAARPVYINGNAYEGTYVRRHSADYRCSKPEVDRMMREASDVTSDATILSHLGFDDLDRDALARFRQRCQTRDPADPKSGYDDMRFLHAVGAFRRDRQTHDEGLTVAGLLFLGTEEAIREWRSRHLIDFRLVTSESGVDERWDDRLVWEGHLFGAFDAIYPRLVADVATPFRLSRGGVRTAESPTHVALREALVNLLVHADYTETQASLIKVTLEGYRFRNPGASRVSQTDLLTGDRSDPRNPILVRMFRMTGLADEAGTGMPKIVRAWRELGFALPDIDPGTERYEFTLDLRHAHLISEDDRSWLAAVGDQWSEGEQLALVMARHEGEVDNQSLRRRTGQHSADASKTLTQLRSRHFLERIEGAGWPPRYQLGGAATPPNPAGDPDTLPTGSITPSLGGEPSSLGDSARSLRGLGVSLGDLTGSLGGAGRAEATRQTSGPPGRAPAETNPAPPVGEAPDDLRRQLWEAASLARQKALLDPEERSAIIVRLCGMAPLSVRELAELLNRSAHHLRPVLRPLVSNGHLVLLYPEHPSHPGQRYSASTTAEAETKSHHS